MANSTWIFPKRTTKNYMLASAGIAKIKLAVLVDVFQTTQSLVNSRCCFAEEERNAQRFISIMKAVLVRHTKHVFFLKYLYNYKFAISLLIFQLRDRKKS